MIGLSALTLAVLLGITWLGHRRTGVQIRSVVVEADRLREAVLAGRLGDRGDASATEAELRPIVEGFNATMDACARPIGLTVEYLDRIAQGESPPPLEEAWQGDFGRIQASMNELVRNVTERAKDVDVLIDAALEDRLDVRGDAPQVPGLARARHRGHQPHHGRRGGAAARCRLPPRPDRARGHPAAIEADWRGEFDQVKHNLNSCVDAVNALIRDANGLAAVEGKLANRADPIRHQGDLRKIMEGVNATLDAVTGPLDATAGCVAEIARGAIPQAITAPWAVRGQRALRAGRGAGRHGGGVPVDPLRPGPAAAPRRARRPRPGAGPVGRRLAIRDPVRGFRSPFDRLRASGSRPRPGPARRPRSRSRRSTPRPRRGSSP